MATEIKFGTDGFRGIIAEDFTFENVEKITKAVSFYILKNLPSLKTVLVGYDPRFMADKFAEFSSDILKKFGLKVFLSRKVVPTPVLAYAATVEKDCAGALMFTASHNPKEYLGIKFIPNYGGPATKQITDEIVSLINQKNDDINISKTGEVIKKDFSKQYFCRLEELIDFDLIKKESVKFIFDGLFSSSIGYFDALLKCHKIDFECVNMHHDPNFGGNLPEPKAQFMKFKKDGFLTFANDGDADRYGVLDEKGEYVSPNIIMAILLKYLKENEVKSSFGQKEGKIIKTVGVSAIVDIVAEKLGIETITTPVGFKWLSEEMRKNKTILAGEDSGGLSTGLHIPEKDGIFANLLILECVSYYQKPLYELKKEIIEFANADFIQDRVDIKLNSVSTTEMLIEKISKINEFSGLKVVDILKIDGIKFFLDDFKSWILMRKSGTEPLLRFYIETDNQSILSKLKDFIKKICSI